MCQKVRFYEDMAIGLVENLEDRLPSEIRTNVNKNFIKKMIYAGYF